MLTHPVTWVELRELDVKVQGIEDEVDSLRMGTQTEARSLVDQISNVETSLAQDIETVKGHIEEKFEERKRHQMLAEDRLNDVTVGLGKENASFRVELEDLRATIERLQHPSSMDGSSLSPSGAVVEPQIATVPQTCWDQVGHLDHLTLTQRPHKVNT